MNTTIRLSEGTVKRLKSLKVVKEESWNTTVGRIVENIDRQQLIKAAADEWEKNREKK